MKTLTQPQLINNLFQTLSSLNLSDLDQVMTKVINLRKQKLPTVLSRTETQLLKKINITAPNEIQKRYNFLYSKRKKETLTDDNYQELLELTTYMESLNVKRLENLIELAKNRNLTLDELSEQLQLKSNFHVI